MIFQQIQAMFKPGVIIRPNYVMKGVGQRRGEPALVYYIPNHAHPDRPSEKGVAESEFEQAYGCLMQTGVLSRAWFNATFGTGAAEPCNFTVIGEVFVKLELAVKKERGQYTRIAGN